MRLFPLLAILLAGCGNNNSAPSLSAAPDWVIQYSSPAAGTSGTSFTFPPGADGVRYVVHSSLPATSGQTVTLVFTLEGGGTLAPTEGGGPARVRLFLQRQGDTLTADEPYKRWWSTAFIDLTSPGTFTLTARIIPEEWSSVFGAVGSSSPEAIAGFYDCVANLANAGFTFGGMFAGHGVVATGDVRFALQMFTIT